MGRVFLWGLGGGGGGGGGLWIRRMGCRRSFRSGNLIPSSKRTLVDRRPPMGLSEASILRMGVEGPAAPWFGALEKGDSTDGGIGGRFWFRVASFRLVLPSELRRMENSSTKNR